MSVRQHTIGVVDDDPCLRKAMARLLSANGYRPLLFASAGDFMSATATSEASCVLVDINLGETSGLDLARELSVAGFKFPLIFMTGVDDDTIQEQCMDFGCVAFLRKPFQEERLLEAVAEAIGRRVRNQDHREGATGRGCCGKFRNI